MAAVLERKAANGPWADCSVAKVLKYGGKKGNFSLSCCSRERLALLGSVCKCLWRVFSMSVSGSRARG